MYLLIYLVSYSKQEVKLRLIQVVNAFIQVLSMHFVLKLWN